MAAASGIQFQVQGFLRWAIIWTHWAQHDLYLQNESRSLGGTRRYEGKDKLFKGQISTST
jgi:hypothetical protein